MTTQEGVFVERLAAQLLVRSSGRDPSVSVHSLLTDALTEEALVSLLARDARFRVQAQDDGVIVSRNVFAHEQPLLYTIGEWRDCIAVYLIGKKPSELSVIGTANPRPAGVPNEVRLKDVLLADPHTRFQITGEGTDIKVKLRLDESEIYSLCHEWKGAIYRFLLEKNRFINMSEIGANVYRPQQLPGCVKLLETIRSDMTGRFKIMGEGNEIKVKALVQLDDVEFEAAFEEWRLALVDYVSAVGHSVELSELGFRVKRPSSLRSVGLQDMLRLDAQRRFSLSGKVNHVRVGLTGLGGTRRSAPYVETGMWDFGSPGAPSRQLSGELMSHAQSQGGGFLSAQSQLGSQASAPPGFSADADPSQQQSDSSLLSACFSAVSSASLQGEGDYVYSGSAADILRGSNEATHVHAWLGRVLDGLHSDYVVAFSTRLRNEAGLVTLQDLLDAHRCGYLTAGMLRRVTGMPESHCLRVVNALAAIA